MEIILLIIVVIMAIVIIQLKKKNNIFTTQPTEQNKDIKFKPNEKIPYRRKYLLTKNELDFYKKLKELADEYGYAVLAKIRLADLIEVNNEADEKERLKYFNKISAKHIDFALVNPQNMYVEYLIELDDNSHNQSKRIERDEFIEKVIEKSGYTLIRTLGNEGIKNKIKNKNTQDIKPIE